MCPPEGHRIECIYLVGKRDQTVIEFLPRLLLLLPNSASHVVGAQHDDLPQRYMDTHTDIYRYGYIHTYTHTSKEKIYKPPAPLCLWARRHV